MEKKKTLKQRKQKNDDIFSAEEPVVQLNLPPNADEFELAISKSLRRISVNARRKAFRKNSAVTIIRNGKILKVHSNRKAISIGTVKKIPLAVDITKPIKIK
jgi:hypothetical protein